MDYYKMFDDFMKNCGYDFSEYKDKKTADLCSFTRTDKKRKNIVDNVDNSVYNSFFS